MSVKHGLLALLAEAPRYGYELKAEFEARTGSTWPLNIGQVYTTLDRLERDGLVVPVGADTAPDGDGGSHRYYALTDAGRAEAAGWFGSPVDRTAPPRDELAIKLALAVTLPGVDVRDVVQRQRAATLAYLQSLTRLKRTGEARPLAAQLVLESRVHAAEAEVRWLDHCEAALTGRARPRGGAAAGAREEAHR